VRLEYSQTNLGVCHMCSLKVILSHSFNNRPLAFPTAAEHFSALQPLPPSRPSTAATTTMQSACRGRGVPSTRTHSAWLPRPSSAAPHLAPRPPQSRAARPSHLFCGGYGVHRATTTPGATRRRSPPVHLRLGVCWAVVLDVPPDPSLLATAIPHQVGRGYW
jgi:hypothetical protein